MKIVLATSNPAKAAWLAWLLEGVPSVERVLPAVDSPAPDIDESHPTLAANAAAKARAWARSRGVPALASDGGLCVPALGASWTPVRTRRAAGGDATDADRAAHLLALTAHLRPPDRLAYQVEALALGLPDGQLLGEWEARGSEHQVAASYDPRDLPPGFWLPGILLFGGRRWADLTASERAAAQDHWVALRSLFQAQAPALVKA